MNRPCFVKGIHLVLVIAILGSLLPPLPAEAKNLASTPDHHPGFSLAPPKSAQVQENASDQPTTAALQDEVDPCMVVATATYLPLIIRSAGAAANSSTEVEPTASNAALKGRVLDANDAVRGVETPLVGVTICSLETGQSVKSDANGNFVLPDLPAGESHVEYIGWTALPFNSYASYRSKIQLTGNTTTEITRPIYLMKIDPAGQVQVNPNQTTNVVNSNLGIKITIPPHTVKGDDGNDFSGIMSISEVPANFTPGSLPDTLEPGFVVTIQPMGLTFTQPAPLTFPNRDNLPPGSEVDFWSMDHATGQFFVAGVGRVNSNGTLIETIRGGIRESSWHFPMPPSTPPTSPGDKDDDNQTGACNQCPCPDSNQQPLSSMLTLHNGSLQTEIVLPGYVSQGQSRGLSLVYNSNRAYPYQLVPVELTIPVRAAIPPKLSVDYALGGAPIGPPVYLKTAGLNENTNESLRAVLPINTSALATGLYSSTLRLTSHYQNSNIAATNADHLIVVNDQGSPLGAGWGVAGLSRLYLNADGSLLVTDGSGGYQLFSKSALDLSTWRREGNPAEGNWTVNQDGISVLQSINGGPTFFISPETYSNSTLKGNFKVETTADDDFIGFVFGYQSPLSANGDRTNDYEFILFDWKQFTQTVNGYTAQEGFSLARVNGVITETTQIQTAKFWGHVDSPDFQILAADYGTGKGWQDNTEYNFELIYSSNRIKISINNQPIFDVLGSFPEGRFGFYNYSQEQVRYANFTSSNVTTRFQGPPGDFSTVSKNNDGTYTRRLKDGTLIQFNSAGLQTAVTDRNGNTTGYGYDGQGRLTTITDPTQQTITLKYPDGLLGEISYPDSRVTIFTHTGSDLTSVLYPDGATQSFGYDGRHLMTSETDRRGLVRTRQFDLYGRVTQAALPDGSTRQTSASQKIGLIDLSTGVGTEANPAPVVRPNQALSNLLDGEGRMMVFSTGPVNRFASITDTANLTTTYTRDVNGNVTQLRRPSGAVYDQTYDASGNLTSAINRTFSNNPTRFAYEGTYNQITSITDPLNQSPTRFTYDAKGNLTQLASPLNRTVTMEYDRWGMVTRLVDPLTTATTFSYNPSGNLNQIIQNPGSTQRTANFTYTPEGYVDILTDALSRPYNYDYDDAGRLITETLPGPRIISYGYDGAGNLTSLTPPGRPAHSFGYNDTGLLTTYNAPPVTGGGTNRTDYSYNLAQQLNKLTRPDGTPLDFTYDTAGRLSRLTFPRGQFNYTYNPTSGYLTGLTAPENVTLQYSYDRDKLMGVNWSGPVIGSVGYTYDGKGRVIRLRTAANDINFSYDADDMVTQARDLRLTYTTQSGLLQSTTLGVISDSWSFNPFAELNNYSATVSGSTLFNLTYNHDNLGRILAKTETISGVTTVYGYRYDPAGRLDQVLTNGAATESYTYDANGNRLTAQSVATASYDDQDRLLSYGNTSYSYNPNGELLTKTGGGQTTTYNYDALGNLMGVTLPTLPISTQITYLVDGQNRRIGKRINGVLTQTWLYQDDLRPIAELNGSGSLVSLFVYASKGNVPDYMIRGGVNYRLLSDHLGSVRLVVNSSTGQIVQRLDYDSFGRVLADTNPGFQPFGFAGGLYDPATGLIRFGARDYDAEVGRWTTKDPIGFAGGDANLYAYVGGEPVNWIDSTGLLSPIIIPLIGGTIAGLANAYNAYQSCRGILSGFGTGFAGGFIGSATGLLGAAGLFGKAIKATPFLYGAIGGLVGEASKQSIEKDFDPLNLGLSLITGGVFGDLVSGNKLFPTIRDLAKEEAYSSTLGGAVGVAAASSNRDNCTCSK